MTNETNGPSEPGAAVLRRLTPEAFASLGAEQIAYIRPVLVDGQPAVAIHAANGQPIGGAPNAALAAAAIIQHGMAPTLLQ